MSAETIANWLSRPIKPYAATEVAELSASIGTTIGDVRQENQDRAVVARFRSARRPERSFAAMVLCDGMGGMADGSRCAEIALSTFLVALAEDETGSAEAAVRSAAMRANAEVNRRYRERGGTTIVAVVTFPGSAAAVSVGDSRLYEISPVKEISPAKVLKQITSDDTIVGELNKLAGLPPSHSGWDSFAGQLAQYVGLGDGLQPRVHAVHPNIAYLLTSDGVHGYGMNPDTLSQVVASSGVPQPAVTRLLQLSRWCGGRDNATLICALPLPPQWADPSPWTATDWMEIWDSSGKLEFPLDRRSSPKPAETDEERRQARQDDLAAVKTRKRASGSQKKRPGTRAVHGRTPLEQGSLKIEIVGDADPAIAKETPGTSGTMPFEEPKELKD